MPGSPIFRGHFPGFPQRSGVSPEPRWVPSVDSGIPSVTFRSRESGVASHRFLGWSFGALRAVRAGARQGAGR